MAKTNALEDKLSLDHISWKILEELQANARMSFAELGRRVGLTTPAAAERVRRLEEIGVITGYHAAVDPEKLGFPIIVFVRLAVASMENLMTRVVSSLKQLPEVVECHRVTGSDSFIIKAQVLSIAHLESLINRLTPFGATSTSTVLSSPVKRREIQAKNLKSFRQKLR